MYSISHGTLEVNIDLSTGLPHYLPVMSWLPNGYIFLLF